MAYTLKDSFTDGVGSNMSLTSIYTKVMQTFTTSEEYTLTRIGVWIGRNPYPGNISGGIYSVSGGLPNSLLESFTMTVTGFSSPGQETFALLDSPLELSSEVQYAIVFDWPGGGVQGDLYGDRNFDSDKYAGGQWLAYRLLTTTWENPYGSGFVDMYFKTYSERIIKLSTPTNTDTGILLQPLLQWTISGTGAQEGDFLDVYFKKNDSSFGEDDLLGALVDAVLNSSWQIVGGLDYNSTYYWQIQAAASGNGELSSSEIWSFTTTTFRPPAVSIGSGGASDFTGVNNMLTRKRFVAAANGKIWYEDI